MKLNNPRSEIKDLCISSAYHNDGSQTVQILPS